MTTTPTQEAVNRERRALLEAQAKAEICACGAGLLVAFVEGAYRLRCPDHGYDPDTRPRAAAETLRRRYQRAGHSIDRAGFTAIESQALALMLNNSIARKEGAGEDAGRDRAMLDTLNREVGSVTTQDNRQVAVRSESATALGPVDAVRFLDFSRLQHADLIRRQAIALVEATGLNPALSELIVYEGKLYVTVAGIGRIAGPELDGIDPPRFWSREEKENAGYAPDDVVCSVTAYRKGAARGVTGTAKANAARPYRGNPVEKAFPQRMAENRALRHVYRLGFQDLLGGHAVELAPEEYEESVANPRVVDVTTGEPATPEIMPAGLVDDGLEPAPAPAAQAELVTAAQLRKLFGDAHRAGWTDDSLKAHVGMRYGLDSSRELTKLQASDLIAYIGSGKAPEGPGPLPGQGVLPVDDNPGRPF